MEEGKPHEHHAEGHADKADKIIKNADRLEKIKDWIKNPYNTVLVGIIVFAFVIRLYFFVKTSGQPLWYDEAEYMSTAKHWAFGIPYELNPQRPPLFQLLSALLFMFGFGETVVKALLVLVPSILLVVAVYLLGKEMFDKRIGLIASFLTAASWTLLFWTGRLQPDSFSILFQTLAVLFMWKHWKEGKTSWVVIAGVLAALGFYLKISALLVPLAFGIFIFIKERMAAFSNKQNYYFAGAFLATLVPYFVWAYLTFGTITAFKQGYSNAFVNPIPFGWYNLNFYYSLTEGIVFALFIAGVLLAFKFILYLDIIVKDKNKGFDPNIFCILVLATVSAFYIFYIRGTDDRWVFLWLPFIFFLVGKALVFMYDFGKKYSKYLAMFVVVGLLCWGAYAQISHAKTIVDVKKESYLPVKQAALLIKDNFGDTDLVITESHVQTLYYAEKPFRSIASFANASEFDKFLMENTQKKLILEVSVFEKHPEWIYDWLKNNENRLTAIQAYFADEEKKQPLLVLYKIENNTNSSSQELQEQS